MAQLTVLGHDFKSLSQRKVLVWSVQFVVTAGTGCNLFSLVPAIAELRLDFSIATCFFSYKLIFGRDIDS